MMDSCVITRNNNDNNCVQAQAGIKFAGRNINNLRYEDDHTEEPLDESERGE